MLTQKIFLKPKLLSMSGGREGGGEGEREREGGREGQEYMTIVRTGRVSTHKP